MSETQRIIEMTRRFGANNYNPLPVALVRGEGVWVEDAEGRRYLDMLSAYSAVNHGHRHPKVIEALRRQSELLTLSSRAFYSEAMGRWLETMAAYTGKPRILPMNTGAEAVETAIKLARRWAYDVKGVPEGCADIVVCSGNFHGRTVTIASFSSEEEYRRGFGPFTPGFRRVPYNDLAALERAVGEKTAALLVEPIQGEAGIVVPDAGYLKAAEQLCRRRQALLIADEIQTGLGRTGKRFAADWDGAAPDVIVLGKALGGGVLPISAVCADDGVMDVLDPGSHGSTFGGNPLACAVSLAALEALEQERLAERALELGAHAMNRLRRISSPLIRDIRGKGLLIGVELNEPARPHCERLMAEGLLCKETHEHTIRLAPPLVIERKQLDWALDRFASVLESV
jgi:ornithine--oxo-acid transaminase